MVIGYTTGVYDLFHIGHLTLLKNAKALCDKLIVGVTVDELVLYKGKHAMIPYSDRAEIVRSIKYVYAVVPQYDMDKLTACKKLGATILFVGDDWYGTNKWKKYEEEFAKEGIRIIYFPYTKGISTTKITEALKSDSIVYESYCLKSFPSSGRCLASLTQTSLIGRTRNVRFRNDIDIARYNGNQKWLIYRLKRLLNNYD